MVHNHTLHPPIGLCQGTRLRPNAGYLPAKRCRAACRRRRDDFRPRRRVPGGAPRWAGLSRFLWTKRARSRPPCCVPPPISTIWKKRSSFSLCRRSSLLPKLEPLDPAPNPANPEPFPAGSRAAMIPARQVVLAAALIWAAAVFAGPSLLMRSAFGAQSRTCPWWRCPAALFWSAACAAACWGFGPGCWRLP